MDDLTRPLGTDLYLMDEQLSDEDRAVRDRVRAFVDTSVLPIINAYWERADFPFELVPGIAGLGVAGLSIEGYGCAGLSRLGAGLVSVELSRGDGKIGKRAVWQPDAQLDGVLVPADNRLAGANSFDDVNRVLTATRVGVAWEALGHALACYEIALPMRATGNRFGRPIAGFQLVQLKLTEMLTAVTHLQLLCYRMAQRQETGQLSAAMASVAKMSSSRLARQVAFDARDVLGGNGLLLGYHVARHLTDMEVVYTCEGTDSMQALIVGREITGESAFT